MQLAGDIVESISRRSVAATQRIEVLQLIDVEKAREVCDEVQRAADAHHATFVLLPAYNTKRYNYLLPLLTSCETLFPGYERRTWRLREESLPRHDRILIMEGRISPRA